MKKTTFLLGSLFYFSYAYSAQDPNGKDESVGPKIEYNALHMPCVIQNEDENTCVVNSAYNVLLWAKEQALPLKNEIPAHPLLLLNHASAWTMYTRGIKPYRMIKKYPEYAEYVDKEMKIAGISYEVLDKRYTSYEAELNELEKQNGLSAESYRAKLVAINNTFYSWFKTQVNNRAKALPSEKQIALYCDIVESCGGMSLYNDAEQIIESFGLETYRSNEYDVDSVMKEKNAIGYISSLGRHAVSFLKVEGKDEWMKTDGFSAIKDERKYTLKEVKADYGKKSNLLICASLASHLIK
ncbi:MAG: hypothetical protein AAF380_01730 [Bacteroidota bacterium]